MPHSRRWITEEDLARHEGEDAASRRTTSMDHRLGSPALRKTKTSKQKYSCCEDAVVDNIDEEYDRLIQHLHIGAVKAESSKVPRSKKRLSPETLELIRQRGIARAACNRKVTSELAKQCRQATKEDLKERKAAVLVEAAEAAKALAKPTEFSNYKTKVIALRHPDGTVTASKKAMEKTIHEYYSDLFDNHVHLPSYEINEDGHIAPPVLPSEIRHAISVVKNRAAPGPNRIRPKHLKNLPSVLVSTLARFFTRYLSEGPCSMEDQQDRVISQEG
ncbi:unnamed protein product [Angiostrongylus costaricensis]|uniref:Uncharacterized protein n=1 Tax=Angiostrongylus costaricensis TaxID=334426 RepID=A0A0R3PIG6_ANGCS|nr:unnamed protein product [Angiostrongylus costaricensis]